MKIRRHKHTKRVIKYYKANFKLETKYFNILIDGTFAHEALNSRINIAEQLPKFFEVKENNCNLFTSKCAINETELLGKPTHGAMLILKQYKLVECNHKRNFLSTEKCFKHILTESMKSNNETRYFVATQVKR
jgi:rRNA-processing protein FCF1